MKRKCKHVSDIFIDKYSPTFICSDLFPLLFFYQLVSCYDVSFLLVAHSCLLHIDSWYSVWTMICEWIVWYRFTLYLQATMGVNSKNHALLLLIQCGQLIACVCDYFALLINKALQILKFHTIKISNFFTSHLTSRRYFFFFFVRIVSNSVLSSLVLYFFYVSCVTLH